MSMDGGALRSILSFLANARTVAYLDDDNSWSPNHLGALLDAIQGKAWAFSHRMLVDEESGAELGVDRWDSVGPGKGRFAADGGFVDTNCLLVDKVAVGPAFGLWSDPGRGFASQRADRRFVRELMTLPYGEVPKATVRYGIRKTNILQTFIRDGIEF
ncbi:hypothetical protein [Phenylobacterium sp. J367]|uniref:hypothetical protein n=1 Tax=Phenylobacterium sp. J367 TaxID=2898435 RepID=UPI002151B894|nr:hypothetical protein [Phenylobacterium sp. J367]MCR5880050.1 hypothetical protein [Phenylobacterium sp. J367]